MRKKKECDKLKLQNFRIRAILVELYANDRLWLMLSILVICTRNRMKDLSTAVESLQRCAKPPKILLVIDSKSDNPILYKTVRQVTPSHMDLIVERCEDFGLVAARNAALRWIEEQDFQGEVLVHFVDDDVEFQPHYFVELENCFEETLCAGACGRTLMPWISELRLRNNKNKIGRLSALGINYPHWQSPERVDVDWLPGCSMSYRWSNIRGMKFDNRRAFLPAGEDVDFSGKLKSQGNLLVYEPKALLKHHMSQANRPNERKWAREDVFHRKVLGKDRVLNCNPASVFIGTLILACQSGAKAFALLNPVSLERFIGTLKGVVDFYVLKKEA